MASNQDAQTLEHRKMLILYGSETGNSEESASDIERMARRLHFRTLLEEMNDVKLGDLLQYPLVIFVVSTTGQGDLPKNARKFWKSLLRKRLPPNCLRQVNFTTFGLGDSSYFQYNWAARKLHKRLEQLGAIEFLPRGEANERHEDGIDGTFLPWCLTLQAYIEKQWPLPLGLSPISPDVQLSPKFTIEPVNQGLAMISDNEQIPGRNAIVAMGGSHTKNTDTPTNAITHTTTTPEENSIANHNSGHNIDNYGRELDKEAAVFSHVDNSPSHIDKLRYELEVENRSLYNNILARLSNQTADKWPGGVDILDRPNVLKDAPAKYALDESTGCIDEDSPVALLPIPSSRFGMVLKNTRLTPDSHWQDVRHLVICLSSVTLDTDRPTMPALPELLPGNVVVIYPKNFTHDVQSLIDLMGWGDVADKPFQHVPRGMELPCVVPRNCYPLHAGTLRDLLTNNYDITCIPRRTFFSEIAHYTDDPTHKERLREFADPAHSDEFWDYTSRPRRSILEVLQDFPSVQIPYQHVPSVFPVIRGREYSIANNPHSSARRLSDKHPSISKINTSPGNLTLELIVALVKYKTVLRKTRQGLCSRYIASLKPRTPINITIRSTSFPQEILEPHRHIIAIAAGTGIAPIRALFFHRLAAAASKGVAHGANSILFYGGRNRTADYFFEEDWSNLGIKVITAFSRDQPHKLYVQNRLLEHHETVCTLLRAGAAVCLCGSSGKMPEAVRAALYDCMVMGGMATSREQAKEKFHRSFKFWEEVW